VKTAFWPRTKDSRNKDSKESSVRGSRDRWREKRGRRAIAVAGTADTVRGEPDLVDAEAEVRSAVPLTISIAIVVLRTSTVDPEVVIVLEPLGMRQDHTGDCEGVEAELRHRHNLSRPTHGTTSVELAELAGNHENVVIFLLFAELLEGLCGLRMLAEPIGSELTFTVVVELAVTGLLDQVENLLQGLAVGRGNRLPPRDGEPSFGAVRKRLAGDLFVSIAYAREELT